MPDDSHLDDNDDLADIESMLRLLDVEDLDLVQPPDDLWAGIERAVSDQADAERVAGVSAVPSTGKVVSLASRRNRLLGPALGIAAATVLAIGGIAVVNSRGTSQDNVVATAVLQFDDGFDQLGSDASATANLVDGDDTYQIALDNTDLPDPSPEDADLELWLIATGDDGGIVDLVSLGIVDGADQTFVVPVGYDPAVYKVVDISVEPHDGNHDHSGRSILRGAFESV
jgi:hypothetical protein